MNCIKSILLLLLMTFGLTVFGQEKKVEEPTYGWELESIFTLNFTQTTFDNWVQGGEDAWSWITEAPFILNLNEPEFSWTNQGKLAFGKTKVGNQSARKASDVIRFESVYSRNLNVYVNPYISLSGQTQFTTGYKYTDSTRVPISDFMDPGYFTQSIGLGYEPNKMLRFRLGAAVKETFTQNYPIPYADNPETEEIEKTRVEFGTDFVADARIDLYSNLLFTSKLVLFSALETFKKVDVDWDNNFTASITTHLKVNLNVQFYYDRDVSKKRQLKQLLSVGFSYALL